MSITLTILLMTLFGLIVGLPISALMYYIDKKSI